MEPTRGYAVIFRTTPDLQPYVLLVKVVTAPSNRAKWFFPGGNFDNPTDAQDDGKVGVQRILGLMSGGGTPPGLPPLTLVDHIKIQGHNTRVFTILHFEDVPGQPHWSEWNPCPQAAAMQVFDQETEPEVRVQTKTFQTMNGHSWVEWAALEQAARSWNPTSHSLPHLNNQLLTFFQRSAPGVMVKISRVLGTPPPSNPTNANPGARVGVGGGGGGGRRPCRYYQQGTCRRGDSCTYSHDAAAPGQQVVCRDFQRGTCTYGDRCRYAHTAPGQGTPAVAASTPVGPAPHPPDPAHQQVCNDFLAFFYRTLASNPAGLVSLYAPGAHWRHHTDAVQGQAAIAAKLQQDAGRLRSLSCVASAQSDFQATQQNLLVLATGKQVTGTVQYPFAHTFVLTRDTASGCWLVQNEILRFLQ